jgi:large subunit ribosomal protein L10
MPLTLAEKKQITAKLIDKLSRIKSAVFAIYSGLTVKDMNELRTKLEEAGLEVMVAKLTLLARAAKEVGISLDESIFAGPTVIVFNYDDEIKAAKIIKDFAKTHEALQIEGGIFEGKTIDAEKVKALGSIPGREELYAKLIGLIQAPSYGLVGVLRANLEKLVYVLNSYYQSKK